MTSYWVTHLEYLPIGNEETALEVAGLLRDELFERFFIIRDGDIAELSKNEYRDAASRCFELQSPFQVRPGEALVALGYIFAATVISLDNAQAFRGKGRSVLAGLSSLSVDALGVRVFATSAVSVGVFTTTLERALVDAFDDECANGGAASPSAALMWNLLSKTSSLGELEIYARGRFFYSEAGADDDLEKLSVDAREFGGLSTEELIRASDAYALEIGQRRTRHDSSIDDMLALNSKIDLANVRISALDDRVGRMVDLQQRSLSTDLYSQVFRTVGERLKPTMATRNASTNATLSTQAGRYRASIEMSQRLGIPDRSMEEE